MLEIIRKSERFYDTELDLANLTALMTPDLSRPSSKVVGSSKNTPKNQTPKHAIDNNIRTKYLNYDAKGSGLTIHTPGGVINGLSLTSAEDIPGRDPSAYKLEGSEDAKNFVLISQGDVPHFKKRNQKHEIFFDNNRSFKSYRITFPKLADIYAKEMQISEIELLKAGTVSNDPLLEEAKKLHIEMTEGRKNLLTTTLVARELPEQRKRVTQILNRGEYSQPIGEPLSPGVFSVLGSMSKNAPANRMGLVDWLTDKKNPLTARVLVNRFWIVVFGEGLVRTPEEFGLQGEHPTHPELLDWLAVDFQENGWNLKRLLKQMMISKTFRQNSKHRVELNDPENKLWGRGPSYRLDAEVLRDLALWSGGLLNRKIGGEGVKPYQPSGMWKALSHPHSNTKNYIPDEDDRIYRRSLYIYWKRTSPHPMMTLFDAPSRETSCVQRSRTNTSLQSLAFFNETQRVESSRKLAERLLHEKKDDKTRIDFLFQILASRKTSQIEYDALAGLLDSARSRFASSPESADSLLSTGLAKFDSSLDSRDVAAWTQVSSAVLASDPVILLY